MKKSNQKINAKDYLRLYATYKQAKEMLDEINDQIKAEGIDKVLSYNTNNTVYVTEAQAQKRYSKEDTEKINALKASMIAINEGQKVLKVQVRIVPKAIEKEVMQQLQQ